MKLTNWLRRSQHDSRSIARSISRWLVPLVAVSAVAALQCSTDKSGPSALEPVGTEAARVQSNLNLRALRAHCDFDGDGRCDMAYWRVAGGNWNVRRSSNATTFVQQWGAPEDIPVPNDYDGDGKTDVATYRPSSAQWAIILSAGGSVAPFFGAPDEIPVPADYDGDTKADRATWQPSTGNWRIFSSATNQALALTQWGAAEDIPVPADYDGDGKADIATFRPSSHQWAVILSSGGTSATLHGFQEEIPVPADYDGDGKADRATWHLKTGNWRIFSSLSNQSLPLVQWGAPEDIPVPGDWDNDHKADIAIWRPSTGHFAISNSGGGVTDLDWGDPGDVPPMRLRYRQAAKGDFDGDRKSDLATFRPSIQQWALRKSNAGDQSLIDGNPNDVPIAADFNGDGKTDIATYVRRDFSWFKVTAPIGTNATITSLGRYDDIPATGDYDGDRKADLAIYRYIDESFYIVCSSTNTRCDLTAMGKGTPVQADYDGDGKTDAALYRMLSSGGAQWSIRRSSNATLQSVNSSSALAEDVPVAADYDGDGRADIALFRPSTGNWTITRSSTGVSATQQWGTSEDIPLPGDFDGDGKADVAIWRPSTGNWSIIPSSTGVAWANKQWGASEDIPLVMTVPMRPWWYAPLTLTPSVASPTTVIGDAPVASTTWGSSFWEFSALAAPPGTNGCANGRRFLSGGAGGGFTSPDLLFKSNLNCTGTGCISTNDIGLLTGWGSGAGGAIQAGDNFTADNTMTRLPNGNLLIARDVWYSQLSPAADLEGIFRSTDCGNTWTLLSLIDPRARVGSAPRYAPPEYPADPNASYGLPQDATGSAGGWDREEVYADPFSTRVYVTAGASGGFSPNYRDTLLFRSSDSGQTWQSTVYANSYTTLPVLMTAVPNRIYFFNCFGSTPLLRWSNDGGATIAAGAPFGQGFHCTASPDSWGGDTSIARVSWSSNGDATLRVTFPDVNPNGDQVSRMFSVTVTNGVVTAKHLRTIETSGSHVWQMTAIEPDVSIPPLTNDNATFYFWKEMKRSDSSMRTRAVIMKDETLTSFMFHVSTTTATGNTTRSWPSNAKTGDYGKGAFSYSTANSRYEYFVPWIEVTSTGTYEMHTKIYGLPR